MLEINNIYCGDCAETMKQIADDSIDLTVTSPPYDNLRDYNGYTFDFEPIARQLWRVTKPGGVVVWVVADATINGSETGTSFRQALGFMALGFRLHDTMIYQKAGTPYPDSNRYSQDLEFMFIFSKSTPTAFNPIKIKTTGHSGRYFRAKARNPLERKKYRKNGINPNHTKTKGNVWLIYSHGTNSTNDKQAYQHPAIFPEALARDHIISWSNPGNLVLDPMCGSGTTLKMAKLLGRDYIGVDVSDEYCKIARARVKAVEQQPFMPGMEPTKAETVTQPGLI